MHDASLSATVASFALGAGAGYTTGTTNARFGLLTGSMTGNGIRLANGIVNGNGEDMAVYTLVFAGFAIGSMLAERYTTISTANTTDAIATVRVVGIVLCLLLVLIDLLSDLTVASDDTFAQRLLGTLAAVPLGFCNFLGHRTLGHNVTSLTRNVQVLSTAWMAPIRGNRPRGGIGSTIVGFVVAAIVASIVARADATRYTLIPVVPVLAMGIALATTSMRTDHGTMDDGYVADADEPAAVPMAAAANEVGLVLVQRVLS